MADISGYIRIINEAEKGEAVRDAITGALEEMNTYGGNASTLENHPASYFATATFFTAVAEQVGEVDDVLIAIENGLNALKYDMGEFILSGSGGSFTVDCTGIKGYDNLDVSKFYFEILGGSDATQAGNWTPTQSYNPETGIFSYSWGALSSNINVRLWIVKPTHTTVGVQVQPLVITENGNWDAGANAAYNPVTIRVPNVIDVRKLTQSITKNGVFTFTPEPNTGFSEVTLHVEVPMPREKVIINQTFTENGTYRAIDEEPTADGYGVVTVNVDQKIIADEKTITANGTYDSIDEGLDGYEKVIVNVPNVEADLGYKVIGQNGTYNAEDDGLDGYSSVNIVVPQLDTTTKVITENGTYDPLDESTPMYGYSMVEVNVPQSTAVLGSKTITSNGTYDPEDDNLDGYNSVTVNVSGGGGGVKYLDNGKVAQASPAEYITTPLDINMEAGLWYEINLRDGGSENSYLVKWNGTETYNLDGKQLQITSTTAGLTYYSGSYRDIYCDIISVGGGGEEVNYTTEEREIGTWVNGDALYQKTIDITPSTGTDNYFNHGISNINLVVDYESRFVDANGRCMDKNVTDNSQYYMSVFEVNRTQVGYDLGSGWIPTPNHLYVTVRYTKTS